MDQFLERNAKSESPSWQHRSTGLHEAIGNFSHANADAVLAASLLLLWQATDW